jgi:mannose-1-phosphate guanylyltransferase
MGNVHLYDTNNSLIVAPPNKLVIVEGLEDYCVIDTPDALIITKIEGEAKFRDMHIDIKREHSEYL